MRVPVSLVAHLAPTVVRVYRVSVSVGMETHCLRGGGGVRRPDRRLVVGLAVDVRLRVGGGL